MNNFEKLIEKRTEKILVRGVMAEKAIDKIKKEFERGEIKLLAYGTKDVPNIASVLEACQRLQTEAYEESVKAWRDELFWLVDYADEIQAHIGRICAEIEMYLEGVVYQLMHEKESPPS